MIIGIAGTLGAGKGTVVEYLKSKGFMHYSSSDILKEILKERGQPLTRDYMSPLADELGEKYTGGILHLSHERATEHGAKNYVLEAIHRVSEAEYIRSLGGFILGVDAELQKRYKRTIKRKDGEKDNVSYEKFLENVRREDEGQAGGGPNIRAVLKTADAMIENSGTLAELQAQVEAALKKLETSK
jgi:dephospho-CoA kinase